MASIVDDDQVLERFAANCQRVRGERSMGEIGRAAGTNAAAIRRIEREETMPGLGLACRVAAALGAEITDLLRPVRGRKKTDATKETS